jgi:hypothetical protein
MAYGISVIGEDSAGNSFYVSDSSTTSTIFLVPTAGGKYVSSSNDNRAGVSGFIASPGTISGITSDTLLFARPYDNINYMYFNNSQPLQNSYYLIAKPNNLLTATSDLNGESYGLQVNNSAGTPVQILDSRKVQKGIDILRGVEAFALTGGDYSTASSYQTGSCVWDGSSQSATEFANTYVTVESSYYSSSAGYDTVIGAYYFNHTIRKIYHVGYVRATNQAYGGGTVYKNMGDILVGELKL